MDLRAIIPVCATGTRSQRARATALSIALAVSALADGTGCARHRAGSDAEPAASTAPAFLVVYNFNWLPVRVAAVRSGVRYNLGTFTSVNGTTVPLPHALFAGSGFVRFVFTLVGSYEVFAPDPIAVEPGSVIEWTIEAQLHHSSVLVR